MRDLADEASGGRDENLLNVAASSGLRGPDHKGVWARRRQRGSATAAPAGPGEFPGDGKPKPVVFPNPSVAVTRGGLRLMPLSRLVELKLASGMTAAHRLKDLADVLELVKAAKLPLDLAATLDASVRAKYEELWHAAQVYDPISES